MGGSNITYTRRPRTLRDHCSAGDSVDLHTAVTRPTCLADPSPTVAASDPQRDPCQKDNDTVNILVTRPHDQKLRIFSSQNFKLV